MTTGAGTAASRDRPTILRSTRFGRRQVRNFLATLFLSQGVPMLLGGDEILRTQSGNNNPWCQDNEISRVDWELDERRKRMLEFARRLIALRNEHPVFRRSRFLEGRETGSGLPDVWWFRPDGRRMARRDWQTDTRTLGVFLNGREIPGRGEQGEPLGGHSFLVLLNADHEPVTFVLPPRRFGLRWALELSTADPAAESVEWRQRAEVEVEGRALMLIRRAQ